MKPTKSQIEDYRLTETPCGWYISEQGIVLTEDCNLNEYLRTVDKHNRIDDKNNEVINRLENKKP
jgi:hypothetical protein|tara:strand:+ start:3862 stop:4056 length:195 start_codon:yes stop_codon:yes gene_type:complete